jgi:hypothetical protein
MSIENTAPRRLFPIIAAKLDPILDWLEKDEANIGTALDQMEEADPDLFLRIYHGSILITTENGDQAVFDIGGKIQAGNPEVGGAFIAGAAAAHIILRHATELGSRSPTLTRVPAASESLIQEGNIYEDFHGLSGNAEPARGSGTAVLTALYMPHLEKEPDFKHCLTELTSQHDDQAPRTAFVLGGAAVVACARLSYLMQNQ